MGITPRQADLLAFLREWEACQTHRGLCPTLAEMAAALGVKSASSAHLLVRGLEERGRIARKRDRYGIIPRSFEIVDHAVVIRGKRYRFIPAHALPFACGVEPAVVPGQRTTAGNRGRG